nr:OmpW family outer membrane protein [Cellulophaga sp. L1A9]
MRKLMLSVLIGILFSVMVRGQEDNRTSKQDYSTWQVRLRGVAIIPSESADIEVIGGDVDISTAFIPELDFTYFFTKHIAAELILGTSNHDVKATDTSVGTINLGDVWLLPPTLTMQYHFTGGDFKPYVGAGVNYTIFYGVDESDVVDHVDYENSVGVAFQAGFDYYLDDAWFINLDVKKIVIKTDATIDATTALGATVGADVDINPLAIGFGLGYRF